MEENTLKGKIVKATDYNSQLLNFEIGLVQFLEDHQLPAEGIFVSVSERSKVFQNFASVINQIEPILRDQSLYLSKFVASVASGLFDAALNYLWDETILQIRKRVVQYDIEYFYDNAVTGDKRKRLKDENDLPKIEDYDLIKGAKEIGLISALGFKHLEYINYMRNWTSAAHPNQNQLTGLQLITWLETCINEVISLPMSNMTIKIKKHLANIKTTIISEEDAHEIAVFFTHLTQEQVNTLVLGFFGIYTKIDTDSKTLQNINILLPLIWNRVDEDTKNILGLRYANFTANNFKQEKILAKEFLQLVNAISYIPDDLRIVEVESTLDNLIKAHKNYNNFYNEPSYALHLSRIIGDPPKVPKQITKKYVLSLIDVFITNGNGVAISAEPIYLQLLSSFDSYQANIAVFSFTETVISNKLHHKLCQEKFKEMLPHIKTSITSPAINDLRRLLVNYTDDFEHVYQNKKIKLATDSLKVLLKQQTRK